MSNHKDRHNKKPLKQKKTTTNQLNDILFSFDKYSGNDVKQQEFRDELNKFFQTLKFSERLKSHAAYFLEYLNPKFLSFVKPGHYNYENVVENVLIVFDQFSTIGSSEIDALTMKIASDCLMQKTPPLKRSILNESLSNKEFFIFLQVFKYFDEDINQYIRCCTFYQVILRSYKKRDQSYKNSCIRVAQTLVEPLYGKGGIFALLTLIIAKVWYNYCSSNNDSEDLEILYKILKGCAQKNPKLFINYWDTFTKKIIERLGGDYRNESETISAMLLALISSAAYAPSVIPIIISNTLETMSPDLIIRLVERYLWIIHINKREFIQMSDIKPNKDEEVVNTEKYHNNYILKDVIFLLLKDIVLNCIASSPETFSKIIKHFSLLEQAIRNENVEKIVYHLTSSLQTTIAKDIYYKRTRNVEPSGKSKDELMTIFLKSIDEESAEITKLWSFIFFMDYMDTPSSSLYLDLIFTKEYQVAEIILWIHSCYTFTILNQVVIKKYLKNKVKELIRIDDDNHLLLTYLKNMEYIVEYSSISNDPNLLGAIYKLLFDLLIFYLEKLVDGKLYSNVELELLIEFIFKVLGSGENSKLLPLIVYEIDNIQYKKIITLLCNVVIDFGYKHHFFQKFIRIIIILSRSEERRFIILLTQIFSILGYQLQAWRNKATLEELNFGSNLKESSSLQTELLTKLKITGAEEISNSETNKISQREAIGLLIIESALGLNITQYVNIDNDINEIIKQIHTDNRIDQTSDTYKSCLGVLRKMFEWLFYESSPDRSLTVYKEVLPRYSSHPFDEYLRKTVFENRFLLSMLQMLILTTDSPGLSDMTLCVLANLISVYNDKNSSSKPYLTTKIIIKTLAQRDIIDQRFSYLGDVVEKITDASLKDITMILFNFICQFNTFNTKKASLIEKAQLVFYRSNIKAILLDEIKNISAAYSKVKDVFS